MYFLKISLGKSGWGYEVITNALPAVDTFFFMSGLLVCYLALGTLEKGRFNIILFYVHRFIRYNAYRMCHVNITGVLLKAP